MSFTAPAEGLNSVTSPEAKGCRQGPGWNAGRTCLLPQTEDISLGSEPVLSRDELDALLGEVRRSGKQHQAESIQRGPHMWSDPQGD